MVLYLYDALVGVHDPKVDHCGHAGGDVVAGYDLLGWYVHGDGPQVHLDHLVHYRNQDKEPGSLGSSLDASQLEDDASLVLLDYLDGADYDGDDEYRDDHQRNSRETYPNRLQQAQGCGHQGPPYSSLSRLAPGDEETIRRALPVPSLHRQNLPQTPFVLPLKPAPYLPERLLRGRTPARPATVHRARTPTPRISSRQGSSRCPPHLSSLPYL